MSECHWCNEPAYPATMVNWNCPGCRARLLAALPSKQARQGWINRWRFHGETAMADAVIAKLREMADANNSNG